MGTDQTKDDYLYALANRHEYAELVKHIKRHNKENVRFGAAGILLESVSSFSNYITPNLRSHLVNSVLTDPSDAVRGKVIELLVEIDPNIADSVIIRLETNPQQTPANSPYPLILTKWHTSQHTGVRYLAVVGFGRAGSQTATKRIETTLIRENEPVVLTRAAQEAGELGDELFVTPLQNYLQADHNELDIPATRTETNQLKKACIDSLIEIGTDGAYEALVTASRSTDEELKQQVIGQIGRFGAKDTVDLVVDELDNDESEQVRSEAAEGVITSFTESNGDGDTIRQRAIEKIGEQIENDVSAEFASIVDESENKLERRNAAWLLGQLGESNGKAINTLTDSIQSDDKYLQRISAASLAQLNDESITRQVESVLSKTDEGTEAHKLSEYVQSALVDTAEEAKKEVIEYTEVSDPSDYTSSARQRD